MTFQLRYNFISKVFLCLSKAFASFPPPQSFKEFPLLPMLLHSSNTRRKKLEFFSILFRFWHKYQSKELCLKWVKRNCFRSQIQRFRNPSIRCKSKMHEKKSRKIIRKKRGKRKFIYALYVCTHWHRQSQL